MSDWLLGETKGIRATWAKLVGLPHPRGIELNVDVSDVLRQKTEYQLRGTVDVPTPPQCDNERDYLAKVLFEKTDIPDKNKRRFRLHSWVDKDGGLGLSVRKCETIPHITEKEIIGEIKVHTAPEVEELTPEHQTSDEKHHEWAREYEENRYCRFESRQQLNQRWQDILVNMQVLKPSGKMGLTNEEIWHRLTQHVVVEMLLRGQPPNEKNLDPRVSVSHPFFDGELCRKAAAIVAGKGTPNQALVKYGKREHVKDVFEKGIVYMNVASDYDRTIHNPAVRDDERLIGFKGAGWPAGNPEQYFSKDTAPENIDELVEGNLAGFSTIYDCPGLERDECVDLKIHMRTNYWMFCMSAILDQRLFADFEADSCVVIRLKPFVERLLRYAKFQVPNVNMHFSSVNYADPLGAFSTAPSVPIATSMPIHMTKVFRYAYQREIRFVCVPRRPKEDLKPRRLQIGPINDIAELIVL